MFHQPIWKRTIKNFPCVKACFSLVKLSLYSHTHYIRIFTEWQSPFKLFFLKHREKDKPGGLWVSPQFGLVHQQSGQCREAALGHPHGVQPPAEHPDHRPQEPPDPAAPLLGPLLSVHPHVWPPEPESDGGQEWHHHRAGQPPRSDRVISQGREWGLWVHSGVRFDSLSIPM